MFEIGPALREARERKGLSYADVEQDTKIRARYIRALEDEHFGVLPGTTYSKGFLRAYADYLGLDGHLFIDEFNSRHHDPRIEDDGPIYPRSPGPRHRQRRESTIIMIVLAAVVAVSAMVVLGFQSSGPPNVPIPVPDLSDTTTQTTGSGSTVDTKKTTAKKKKKARPAAKPYTIEIVAALGDSWLSAHKGSAKGPEAVSVKGTPLGSYPLVQGETAVISAKGPIHIKLGAPGSITITIAGRERTLPAGTAFVINRSGIAKA
ncbi:MAG: cytoskeleton protein RodZ [Gaiellales bacterium]|jgi:cytoskeletal protein RodZ|nr:cytoskeleton protein RodZ [Gaiellales bacterium]